MFSDYHTHTIFSDDSEYVMEDCVKDAITMGLKEICFTDHVDYGVKDDLDTYRAGKSTTKNLNVDYEAYFKELDRLQGVYEQQIKIKKGLEFGMQMHTIPAFQQLFNKYPLDFVILSIHQVNDKEFWTHEFQENYTEAEYYRAYYAEMYNVVTSYHDYSVLGHMDMLKRYDEKDGYDSFAANKAMITKILQYVIADGKGIELNTSSIRYGLPDLMPSKEILSLYLALGGKIITIGSDSHSQENLTNSHIEEMKKTLKQIGFKQFCTFSNMQPTYHNL